MPAPILATKLFIPPPRPKLVLRPRLSGLLDEGMRNTPGATLISAPAGFGKTTLVSEWVAGSGRPVAWLSLDEGDNDPNRFLAYLVAALQTIAPQIGAGVLSALQSAQPQPVESLLTTLINDISSIPHDFLLVLDDYHVIEAKAVGYALAFLLEHLPPHLHLVIATREDPQLPLARLRARNQLTELRAAELRFTPAEAAEFLNQVMSLNLSAEDIGALETRTEGWIAGLQLAAISLQGCKDGTGFIESFTGSHRFVLDYLVEEVLQQQPEGVQAFLLRTSILERMCGPLCDVFLGTPSAPGQETLEYLERANLFIIPLDNERRWYRYHHLFADVLQARLMKEQPDQMAGLHLRACAWYEQNEFRPEAIHHALAAGNFERAADLIEKERSVNIGRYFQNATWLGWVKALPDELVRTRPKLSIGFAWEYLFSGQLEAAEDRLKDVDRWLELTGIHDPMEAPTAGRVAVSEEELQALQVSLAIARAFLAQARGDAAGTAKHARQALDLISETDFYTRGLAGSLLGLACLTNGDLETAHKQLTDAMASLRAAGSLFFGTSAMYVLADIRLAQGRLSDAIGTYEEALQLMAVQGGPVIQGTADMVLGLSELYRERGDMEAARQHLLRSEELGKPAALDNWPHSLYIAQARFKEDQGDLDGALVLLDQAEQLHRRSPVPDVRPTPALKTRVWLRQGRLAEAFDWTYKRHLAIDDELSYLREFEHITLARVLIACHKNEEGERSMALAVGLLERLLKAAQEGGRMGSAIEILVLQALAHKADGNLSMALAPLERALTLAEPEGYVRIFVDEGEPLRLLLLDLRSRLSRQSPLQDHKIAAYLDRLLASFGPPAAGARSKIGNPESAMIEPLSPRELEVLQLIAQGLSNHEIGRRLFLAVDTVKGHNRKIFDKLQVRRRTEAIARARQLGLL